MDTFSSSISNLQVPKPFNPHHHLTKPTTLLSHHHLTKPTTLLSHHHHNNQPSSAAKTTATSSISTLPQKDNFTPLLSSSYTTKKRTPSPLSSSIKVTPPRASIHRRAASGYAAALLDISQRNGTVLKVEKDVRRVLRLVFGNSDVKVSTFMKDEWVEEKEKGEVVVELMEKAKFEVSLVGLVKMLVKKGQSVELVKQVLEEFLRVFQQLITTTTRGVSNAPTSRLALS